MASKPPDEFRNIYDLQANDPHSRLIDRSGISEAELQQMGRLLGAMGRLREAENRLAEASQRQMALNQTDLKALHYLIALRNRQEAVTPGMLAGHLGISTASTTKLLDRLETAGHLVRLDHPEDRRARLVDITDSAHEQALEIVGRQHARRFHVVAALDPHEREVVIRFLEAMTAALSGAAEPD